MNSERRSCVDILWFGDAFIGVQISLDVPLVGGCIASKSRVRSYFEKRSDGARR